jgi:hypothetical protein
MKQLAFLLILLVFWAQVDDSIIAVALPSAPLTEAEDDEYLPSQRQVRGEEESFRRPQPVSNGPIPLTAAFAGVRRGVAPAWDLAVPFAPPPLYVFMSLQI